MKQLLLEDLKDLDDDGLRKHLADSYEAAPSELEKYDVLLGYESVGSWGCDSSSYFLLRKKDDGKLYEVRGSHCSCYGFEGQFEPEEATVEYLKSDKFNFWCGGYDENETANKQAVAGYMRDLVL